MISFYSNQRFIQRYHGNRLLTADDATENTIFSPHYIFVAFSNLLNFNQFHNMGLTAVDN